MNNKEKIKCPRCKCYRDTKSFKTPTGINSFYLLKEKPRKNCLWCREKTAKHYKKNKERSSEINKKNYAKNKRLRNEEYFFHLDLCKWYYYNVQKLERRKISNCIEKKYVKPSHNHPWRGGRGFADGIGTLL